MRRSKQNKYEKKRQKKDDELKSYYAKSLKTTDEAYIRKIMNDTNVYLRSDGTFFCKPCIMQSTLKIKCWCCVEDDGYKTYQTLQEHISNVH